jgi:hypothetical protein
LNCITNCIFNWIGIGHGFELGDGFGWEMEWIGIGHITWIGNDWEFGFVPYMFRHKNGMELDLDMYLKLDGNLDLKLVHGYWI